MAVLGVGGQLRLKREAPEPTVIGSSDLHVATRSIYTRNPALWSGDQVTISCDRGLPLAIYDDLPACPDGYAIYAAGPWPLNPRTLHLQDDNSAFYTANDTNIFYTTDNDVGQLTTATYFIYRDQLDRLSFYKSRGAALRGQVADRVELFLVDFSSLTMSASSASWMIQADLQSWSLNLNAPEVDTTSVGDKFGEAVKSIVNGGGSFDFLVDRKDFADKNDSTGLMQLLLLTEKGCKAEAEFWMLVNRQGNQGNLLPGDLYYTAEILVTSSAVNVRPDEVIAGSANFVTIGEIALRMGPN